MKGEEDARALVEAVADCVVSDLDLGWLTIDHKFSTRNDAERVAGETTTDWEYRQASLHWNLAHTVLLEADELEAVVVHEIVHVLIAPLWNELPDKLQEKLGKLNELATENVTRAIVAALKATP